MAKDVKTCAIVQLEAVHEAVMPAIIHAMNANGVRPTIYLNERCKFDRGDIFEDVDALDYEVHYVSVKGRPAWDSLFETLKSGNFDFIFMNTFQRDGIAEWSMRLDLPLIGIVHNVKMFLRSEPCVKALTERNLKIVTHAPHVAAFLHQRLPVKYIDSVAVVDPLYWVDVDADLEHQISENRRRTVSITGGVNFKTRGYRDLMEALVSPKTRHLSEQLTIQILGGGGDRAELEAFISEHGLDEAFELGALEANGRVAYKNYIGALRRSDFLHPLLPLDFAPYREHKITSAITNAIAFHLPIVLDRWTERVYKVPALISNTDVGHSLEVLANVSPEEYQKHRQDVIEFRRQKLEENAYDFGRLIDQLGLD